MSPQLLRAATSTTFDIAAEAALHAHRGAGADRDEARTAAFLIAQMTHGFGRITVFIGDNRDQCQDIAGLSFRSYLREHASRLNVEESRLAHGEPAQAYRLVSEMLASTNDLVGIFIVGGEISGVLRAIREMSEDRRKSMELICRDIGLETRKGLSEGLIAAALRHPLETISSLLVQTMIDVASQDGPTATYAYGAGFQLPTFSASPISTPISMSVSLESPRHMTMFPGG